MRLLVIQLSDYLMRSGYVNVSEKDRRSTPNRSEGKPKTGINATIQSDKFIVCQEKVR